MRTYHKILIAVDSSEYSINAAKGGFALAHQLKATAAMVFVIESTKALANPDLHITAEQALVVLKREAQQAMDGLAQMFNGKDLLKFMPEGKNVFREIIKLAGTWGADLIVMGTHGRTGLEHLLVGSIAEHVMRRSTIPVMIVPTKRD